MATKAESSAAENVTTAIADPYSPENLFYCHLSLGLAENPVKRGILSQADFKTACKVLTRKHGLPKDSIFAEITMPLFL